MPTIRFRDLVKMAGSPEPKSLWTDPQKDRGFMQAVKQNRVVTVVQEPSSKKKDFGEIGFHQQPYAAYFIFPKPLPESKAKVIGIKYDLIKEAKPRDTISLEDLKRESKPPRKKSPPKEKPRAVEKAFNLRVRRVAVIETNIQVKARNKTEARKQAAELMKGQGFDLSQAKIQNQISFAKS